MTHDHTFAITFLSGAKTNAKCISTLEAEQKALEITYEKINARLLCLNFVMCLKAAVSKYNMPMSKMSNKLELDLNHLSEMYVNGMILIISLDGTASLNENDISKLVSFFQLNHDQNIIFNNTAIACTVLDYHAFRPFCGLYINSQTDPIIAQLLDTLQINFSYIWNTFSSQVRTYPSCV